MKGRSTLRRALILCLLAVFVIGMTACSGGGGGDSKSFTGDKYTYDGSSFSIDTKDLPKDYELIKIDKFREVFKQIVDGDINTESTYKDIAKAFGDDGIQMTGIEYEGYAYYSWYSDEDYTDSTKTHVLITFKADGEDLTYYAYSSVGITGEDVRE